MGAGLVPPTPFASKTNTLERPPSFFMSRRSSSLRSPSRDIYQTVTDRIIAAVEANPAHPAMPWHRSGLSTLLPTNAATGNDYRGINIVALWAEAQIRGFPYAVWASYRQWAALGAQVRKGESGALVVFYKELDVPPDPDNVDDQGKRRIIKSSFVFNSAQVDSYTPAQAPIPLPALDRVAQAEAFATATGARIETGGENAYYCAATDHIQMPDEDRFRASDARARSEDWYSVLAHELGHWTGAKHRLARQFGKRFGDHAYCAEELVAELTSAFVVASLGITPRPRDDHAQYIAHYLKLMRADKRAIFTAAAKAAEATEFLKGFSTSTALGESGSPLAQENVRNVLVDRGASDEPTGRSGP